MKTVYKSLIFAALVLAGVAAQVEAQAAPDIAAALQADADQIATILQSHTVPLSRDVTTFHYEAAHSTTLPTLAQIQAQMTLGPERFYRTELYNSDLQGIGLYLAVDPSSSRSYGESTPYLYVIPIKKGTRILNLMGPSSPEEYRALKAIADKYNCVETNSNGPFASFEDVTRAFRNSKNVDCRNIISKAYAAIGVEAILYTYSSDNYTRGCRSRNEAFNLISGRAIKKEGIALFTDHGSLAPKTLARYISQIYQAPVKDYTGRFQTMLNSMPQYQMPNSLNGLQVFDLAAQSWRKRNMLRCGDSWSIEAKGNMLSVFMSKLKDAFTDQESQDALLQWHLAYKSKIDPNNYDSDVVNRINEIEKASYAAAKLAPDLSEFEHWKSAVDIQANYDLKSEDRNSQAAAFLHESYPHVDDAALMQLLQVEGPKLIRPKVQPGLIGALLKTAGIGPRLSRLMENTSVSGYGYPVFLMSEDLNDPDADYTAILAKNKQIYLKIIRECTAQMLDPNLSKEAFQASPCGVRPKAHH